MALGGDVIMQETQTVGFQRQALADCFDELQPLVKAHHAEVAFYQDINLDVDWEAVIRLEQAGALRLYTARDFGSLRGYAVFVLGPALHYKGTLQATADAVYLEPGVRKQMLGVKFLRWCDEELRREGVVIVAHHHSTRQLRSLYGRLGYELAELVWTRRLDR